MPYSQCRSTNGRQAINSSKKMPMISNSKDISNLTAIKEAIEIIPGDIKLQSNDSHMGYRFRIHAHCLLHNKNLVQWKNRLLVLLRPLGPLRTVADNDGDTSALHVLEKPQSNVL